MKRDTSGRRVRNALRIQAATAAELAVAPTAASDEVEAPTVIALDFSLPAAASCVVVLVTPLGR